ncbi:MAG: SpoIID/LytB domain-containing protein [Oscillospiraceae bacterium]|jgi:stage II sporulation protein D|nr:SpoIID/LytB domain-containing protein [Oscillospiraceae bacterium]
MKRLLCLFLCAAMLPLVAPPGADAAPEADFLLRIGLSVKTNTEDNSLVGANLDNYAGLGYEFGFLNADNAFVPLGTTTYKEITMVKNRNVYLANGAYSDNAGGELVGAFHVSHGSYPGRTEAEAAVASLRAQGVSAFVSYSNGVWEVRSGSYADSGGARVSGSKYCISVVRTGTTDILFQFDYGTTAHLCVRPLGEGGEKPITWHKGKRYYGMFEFRRFEGNNIYVYNAINVQDYVKGVLPYEMSPTWPIEALKSQAVAARSYAAGTLRKHRAAGYALCTSTDCQVYRGMGEASALTNQAVDETYGQFITYNGAACKTAVYHSSSGGATENSENVWNEAVPYLRGVVDNYEDEAVIPNYIWRYTCTNDQLSAMLTARGVAHNGVGSFYIQRYTDTSNVHTVAFNDRNGNLITSYSKEMARIRLNFGNIRTKSLRYNIYSGDSILSATAPDGTSTPAGSELYALDGTGALIPVGGEVTVLSGDGSLHTVSTVPQTGTDGVYIVIGRGDGHNLGMSQWGAHGMADQGFSYIEILKHYYTGVEVGQITFSN